MLFPPLNEQSIRDRISPESAAALAKLTLLEDTGSTNDYLLQLAETERHAHAVLADRQTAGRGRRGRRWQSPPGCNIYLSVGWAFSKPVSSFSCLPLAAGVAVVRGIEQPGLAGIGLKWPNDIQAGGRKLGGLLLESRTSAAAVTSVVIGIGLNVGMPPDLPEAKQIDQPWTCVAELLGSPAAPRHDEGLRDRLSGLLLDQVICCLLKFEESGFTSFYADWQRLDVLQGKRVNVSRDSQDLIGEARGIDINGNLLLVVDLPAGGQQLQHISSGDVSVRLAPKARS